MLASCLGPKLRLADHSIATGLCFCRAAGREQDKPEAKRAISDVGEASLAFWWWFAACCFGVGGCVGSQGLRRVA